MVVLKEVGLECEYFLLDENGEIVEAPKYNFPADEMGFLIELRTSWGRTAYNVVGTLEWKLKDATLKAEDLNLQLKEVAWLPVSSEWQRYIAEKYHHADMIDHTRNIYNIKETQHTGFREGRATAGCHVHFSKWDTEREAFIPFSECEVALIVAEMDYIFESEIKDAERIAGEWEPKGVGDDTKRPHGFEYRSLPATIPKRRVVLEALKCMDLFSE